MASLVVLLLGALLWVPGGALRCCGDAGQPVDWFVIYKLPAQSGPGNETWRGLRYRYLDESSGGWRDGVGPINSSEGAVGRSLQPLYRANASQLAFLVYNDQPPKPTWAPDVSSHGHAKGTLLLDREGGFWLVHSVPHFPPPPSPGAYTWPYSARTYGQTLICVSFPLTEFTKIGRQLAYIFPLVYNYKLDDIFAQEFPDLVDVVKGQHIRQEPWNSSVTLTSQAGTKFQSFAKAGKFGDDLYSGWLAEALGTDLQVQFWPNSPEDHSKWCVAPREQWACVCDMNRNHGEEYRGGGTLCTQLPALWKAFQPLVKAFNPCEGDPKARKPGE